MDKKDILNKLLVCARVLIVLAVINTILLLIAIGEPASKQLDSTSSENSEETGEYDVSMFDAISGSDFVELFNKSKGTSIVYLGREGCSYCVAFLPVLQKAQSEIGYKTKYLDITTVEDKDAEKISKLNDFLKENYGSTPLVMVMKDGKYVDGWVGYGEYDEFVEFLKKAGVK